MARRINRSSIIFIIGMTLYWSILRIDFYNLFSIYTSENTGPDIASLLIFIAGMLVLCLIAFSCRKAIVKLRNSQLFVLIVVGIGVVANFMLFICNTILPGMEFLIPWSLILGFATVIALTYAWMSFLPRVSMQKIIFRAALSFSLSFVVSLPVTLLPWISWPFFSIVSALSALFWMWYVRTTEIRGINLQISSSSLPFSHMLSILVIIALLIGSFLRIVLGHDEAEITTAFSSISLVRMTITFICSIIIVAVSLLINRVDRILSISLSILLILFFAGLLVAATLSQSELAARTAEILVVASRSLLSFFLWILLACSPARKQARFTMTAAVVFLLVEAVYRFSVRCALLIAGTYGISLGDNISVIGLTLALMLIVICIVFFNSLGGLRTSTKANDTIDDQSILQNAKATYQLTDRETEVLELIVQGRSYRKIGEILCISPNTVQTHTKNLYRKLGAHTKQEIIDMFNDLAK